MAKQTFTTGQVLTAAQMTSLQQTAMGGGSTTAKTVSYVLLAADAGTVVAMNSGSATTITVNTSLFSAGDTVTIQNIGSGVCTITAGTATVTTASSLALAQYEGGTLYFTSASAAIFFKSDGAAPASGGMTLLSTTNLSSTTTTISGISGSYNNLIILVQNPYVSAGSSIYIKPNNANLSRNMFIRSTSVSSDTNALEGNSNLGTTTNADLVGYVAEIYNYADTTYAKPYSFWGNAASGANNMARFGILTTASAITSLDVTTFGGTATFSGGRVLIYGVK